MWLKQLKSEYFQFSENFLRMVFLASTQVTTQVTTQVETLLKVFTGEHTRKDLQELLNLENREHFRKTSLQPAID